MPIATDGPVARCVVPCIFLGLQLFARLRVTPKAIPTPLLSREVGVKIIVP